MKLLTLQQALEIHVLVITETGGSSGIRDLSPIKSAIAAQQQEVFGQVLYATIFEKSAAILRTIIGDHPFVDGNKRTAILMAITLLDINQVKPSFRKGELEDFAVKVATDKLTVGEIADWLEVHCDSRS